jgi:hypothetical protein
MQESRVQKVNSVHARILPEDGTESPRNGIGTFTIQKDAAQKKGPSRALSGEANGYLVATHEQPEDVPEHHGNR